MHTKPLSITQLREFIHKGEANDPLVFLESIMNGQDPRKHSGIYKLLLEVDAFTDGDITQGDWSEIMDYVLNHAKYNPVTLGESTHAAKTLAEYLHPKRKQVELTGGLNGAIDPSASPLTEEDIELFREKFNDDF